MKQKKCRVCRGTFHPFRTLQLCCSAGCAIEYAQKQRTKKELKEASKQRCEHRKAKEAIKTRAQWMKEAEKACNAYIRARDGNVCISCGTTNPNIQYAAGHYRTVKAASQLRYNEDNIHVQCNYRCNSMLSGNLQNYRPALIAKIGIDRVEALENNNVEMKYTIEELIGIRDKFKAKLKALKNGL